MSESAPYSSIVPGVLDCPSLNMLAGASGLGKTALLASMMVTLRTGGTLFGQPALPPPAIGYISTDRPWSGTRPWFERAGFTDFPHYSLVDDVGFDVKQLHGGKHGPDHFVHCAGHLDLPPGSLIIVDPIALFLGGKLNDYTSVSIACIAIQRYLIAQKYCVIGVCHTSKLKADVTDRYARPQDRILGSGALLGYSSTQMYFMGPDESGRDDNQYTFLWNPHLARSAEFLVKRDMSTGLFALDTAYETLSFPEDKTPTLQVRTQRALTTILDCFPPAPETITTGAILARVTTAEPPVSQASLFRHLGSLARAQVIESVGHGVWRLVVKTPVATGETPPEDGGASAAPTQG